MGKRLKLFFYVFIVGFIGVLLFNSWADDYDWAPTARLICIILCGISLLVYLYTFLYCFFENKKIGKLMDKNEYDKILKFLLKKEGKKNIIMPERNEYYNYLALDCYLSTFNEEKSREYFNKFNNGTQFGVVYYWRACFEFIHEEYDNIEELKNKFVNSFDYIKNPDKFSNLESLLECLISFSKGNVAKAKERLEKVKRENITMPSTLKAIEIIEKAEIKNQDETIEKVEEKENNE